MYKKIRSTKSYPSYLRIWALLLITALNLSFFGIDIYPNEYATQTLRPSSYKNHLPDPNDQFFSSGPRTTTPVSTEGQGDEVEGAVTKVRVFEGIVGAAATDENGEPVPGTEVLVPAGWAYRSDAPTPRPLSTQEFTAVPDEFSGTAFDRLEAQLKVLYMGVVRKTGSFRNLNEHETKNKVIEINTDIFPDFDPATDVGKRNLVTAVLSRIAYRLLIYQRDRRFSGRVYIDFVSRTGAETKRNAVIRLFKDLDYVKDYQLERLLFFSEVEPAERLTVTHSEDKERLANPALMLSTPAASQEDIMVYPWDAVMDLSVGILSIDRSRPVEEQIGAYNSVKSIFEDLLKRRIPDELMRRFLSDDVEVSSRAAVELALPPVERFDYEAVEELNRIMAAVGKYA